MVKVLVIGGLGFVGSYISNLLVDSGYDVTVLSRSNKGISRIENRNKDKIKLIIKDLREIEPNDIIDFSYILNLASSVDNYAIQDNEPYRDVENNCTATISLLEAIRINKERGIELEKLIFVSTFFVYGNLNSLPATEDSKPHPLSLYGLTRLCGEDICRIYGNTFDLKYNIARLSNIYGPKESRLDKKKAAMNFMIHTALQGRTITQYEYDEPIFRDYLFVKDAASGIIKIMEKGATNEIYNIATGKPKSLDELFQSIIEVADNGDISKIQVPKFHKSVGIRDFWADITKIRSLGWEPETSFKDGVKLTLEYYKSL